MKCRREKPMSPGGKRYGDYGRIGVLRGARGKAPFRDKGVLNSSAGKRD